VADLSTSYLGLKLKKPIIAASSGLTDNLKSLQEQLKKNDAATIILKPIFEDEITHEYEVLTSEAGSIGYNAEHMDYFDYQIREKNLLKYTELIKNAKKELSIPIIASINCYSTHEWEYFASNCEKSEADTLELNIFSTPTNFGIKSDIIEDRGRYLQIAEKIISKTNIPITLKISPYFSNLGSIIQQLSTTGIKGLVLFNRFFGSDFDIDKLELCSSYVFSNSDKIAQSLKWTSTMSNKVECDLAASTRIDGGETVIKQLLVGTSTVQLATALYQNRTEHIRTILSTLGNWMDQKNFKNIAMFRGKLSQTESSNPDIYDRIQFMKFFSGKF
jgi:dihydroorotate dehydrogenase (fumarate)